MSILQRPAPSRKTDRPGKPIGKPRPRPFGAGILPPEPETNDIDRAWNLGFELGQRGAPSLPPSDWPDVLKDAFFDGYGAGEAKREAEHSGAFNLAQAILDAARDEWEAAKPPGSFHDSYEWNSWLASEPN